MAINKEFEHEDESFDLVSWEGGIWMMIGLVRLLEASVTLECQHTVVRS